MGFGFRAFVVTLLGFVVFGAALAAWHGGDEEDGSAVSESVAGNSGAEANGSGATNESAAGESNATGTNGTIS